MKTKKAHEMKGFLRSLRSLLFNKNKPLNSTAKGTKDAKNGKMKLEKQQPSELSSFAPFASFAVK
jgi:hypothetical protein